MRTFLNLFKPIKIDSEPNKNLFSVLRKNVDLSSRRRSSSSKRRRSSSSGRRRSSSSSRRRRSSSSRRRRSYDAGSKRFSQVQQGSQRFNVCAGSNRTDGPPRTPLKGSPPTERFGSGSGSTDSPVRYAQTPPPPHGGHERDR